MDMKQKVKQDVLQQIIDMMDEKESGLLKSKSPKFAKVDIQSDDPALADSLKDKLVEGIEDEHSEEMAMPGFEKPEEDDEDMEKLMEMYSKLNK